MRFGEHMWQRAMTVTFFGGLLSAAPLDALAQQPAAEASSPTQDSIETIQAQAEQAEADGRWEDALKLYERAYLLDADGYYIYRRALIYEQMGQHDQALELLKGQREQIAESTRVTDLPLAIDRLEQSVQHGASDPIEPVVRTETTRPAGAQIVTVIGATALLAGGVVWGLGRRDALALACSDSSASRGDARCNDRQDTRRYDEEAWDEAWQQANLRQTAGVVSASVGGAMVVGGIIWLIVGKKEEEQAVRWLQCCTAGQVGGAVQVTF